MEQFTLASAITSKSSTLKGPESHVGNFRKKAAHRPAVTETEVFAADAGNRVILRYDKSGKLLRRIGEKDKERNVAGFIIPSPFFDVEIARDGLLRQQPGSASHGALHR